MDNLDFAQEAVDVLNEALKMDREAIAKLINKRVKCNSDLISSNVEIVVTMDDKLGPLGLINGILIRQTGDRIVAVYEGRKLDYFILKSKITEKDNHV